MKQALILFFLMTIGYCNAQDILAEKGVILLATNEKINFEKLELAEKQFRYIEPTTGEKKEIAMNMVKAVDDEKHNRVFTNRKIIISTEFSQGILVEKTKADSIADAKKLSKKEIPTIAANGCPDGIYQTKQDFINKIPSSTAAVVQMGGIIDKEEIVDYTPDACYFYLKKEDKKIKKVFAVCYKGQIYFQTGAILNNRNKTDRAQINDYPNVFVRVRIMGENYYYTEVDLVNKWAQSFAFGGGIVGGALSKGNLYNAKGIVWDVKNKEFNIFKNCDDYNEFIKTLYPDGVQECKDHQPDIEKVREAIKKIN